MVSLQQLIAEGLVPQDCGSSGGEPVMWGNYDVVHFDHITATNVKIGNFSDKDFLSIYLQIEGLVEGFDTYIAVKMEINAEKAGRAFDKERVRRARQLIQDYFARKVPACVRTRFQFNSPKENAIHASWLTVCRVPFDETNYSRRITQTRQAFDNLNK